MKKIKDLNECKWNLWVRKNSKGKIIEIADWCHKDCKPPAGWGPRKNIPWEEMTPFMFEATVRPDGYEKGCSAVNFLFVDVENGIKYPVSASGTSKLFQAIVQGAVEVNHNEGTFTAIFKWTKKGKAFSVDPVLP